jgi:hypothetical protein
MEQSDLSCGNNGKLHSFKGEATPLLPASKPGGNPVMKRAEVFMITPSTFML